MKKITILSLIIFSLFSTFLLINVSGQNISENLISIKIKQNGKTIPIQDNAVTISRAPFEIVFTHKEPISFLVNASLTAQTFYLVDTDIALRDLPGFTQTGMAEGLRNDALHITLSKDAPNAWMYNNKDVNRFDKVSVRRDSIQCSRTIETIRYGQERELKIEQTDMDVIYLAIAEYEFDSETYESIQLSRMKLEINFRY